MPIFKKGSRARERERGAATTSSSNASATSTGNRGAGGGATDGDGQDQQLNAEPIEAQQQQQQQQQQQSQSSSGGSSPQPRVPPAIAAAPAVHAVDQRQQLEPPSSSSVVQMDGDMTNMVAEGGRQISYGPVAGAGVQHQQQMPQPYGNLGSSSPDILSQVAPLAPPNSKVAPVFHSGHSGDDSFLPQQPMALQMPMQVPTRQHQHQHHPYGPSLAPTARAADIAAAACAQQQQQQPPQRSQDVSPLHITVGPALVPVQVGTTASSVAAAHQPAVHDDNNNDNVYDVPSSGVERDADITDSDDDYGEEEDDDEEEDDNDLPLPTVTEAAEDVWHNDADDFVGVAESLRILRLAILATADGDEGDVEGRGTGTISSGRRRDEFDPAETFLSIQGAALRYHARWEGRVKGRLRERDEREQRWRVRKERKANKLRLAETNNSKEETVSDTSQPAKEISSVVENATDLIDKGKASTMTEIDAVVAEGKQGEEDVISIALVEEPTRTEGRESIVIESSSLPNGDENEEASDDDHDDDATVSTNKSSKRSDAVNWEEDEQAAWDVWEEAAAVAAALATVCVGPAWRSQIRRRRQWLVNGRTDLLVRHNSLLSDDGMSVSTVGMGSVAGAAWQAQAAQEHAQLTLAYGQAMRQTLGGTPELEEVADTSLGSNPQAGGKLMSQGASGSAASAGGGFENWHHPIIPEVLPAAMLRFASSIGEMALPPLRTPDSAVQFKERSGRSTECSDNAVVVDDERIESSPVADAVGRAIWEEQRWLVRRQRVGNAQRDLVLSLCCDTADVGEHSTQEGPGGSGGGEGRTGSQRSSGGSAGGSVANNSRNNDREGSQWNIAGSHLPVASMLLSWIETANAGWPTQRRGFDPHAVIRSERLCRSAESVLRTEMSSSEASKTSTDLVWSQVAKGGAIDWWYVLQVSRAVADLVAAGWRPPPRGGTGENCVQGLLEISRRGLVLSSRDLKSHRRATDQDAREERLAASSSAAETLSALASIGSRGHLPWPSVAFVAKGLCSLLASVDSTMSHISLSALYPLAATNERGEEAALLIGKETFISQRESCVADIAELLWSLLAHRSSACIAVTALLHFIETELFPVSSALGVQMDNTVISLSATSNKSGESRRSNRKAMLAGAGAIRALAAALWGDPPQVGGVSSLRIFWDKFLEMLSKVSSSINCPREFHSPVDDDSHSHPLEDTKDTSKSSGSPDGAAVSKEDREYQINQTLCLCEQSQPSLVVMLEVAAAIRRLADGEFIRRVDTLAPDEWGPFLTALENLVPWLDCKLQLDHPAKCSSVPKRSKFLLRRTIAEVRAIFDQTESFLTRGDIDSTFHCIVDDEYRQRLHTLMLRTACPLLQSVHATNLATSVVRSWTWGGYYLNRGDEWYKIASQVLGDAFALYNDDSFGFRGYVHPPSVRLEGLLAVSQRYGETTDNPLDHQRTPTRGGSRDATYTPDALATKLNEMQVERICPFFLPYLHEVLTLESFPKLLKRRARVVLSVPSSHRVFVSHPVKDGVPSGIGQQIAEEPDAPSEEIRALIEKTIKDEFRLRRSAVRIIGRLFRIMTSDRSIRSSIISTLRDVAKSICSFTPDCFPVLHEHAELFEMDNAKILMATELLSVSLEATSQLEDCLATPFGARPLTYWCAGQIVEALCGVVQDVSASYQTEGNYLPVDAAAKKLLVFAALLPLARIRVFHDTRAVMCRRAAITSLLDDDIIRIIDSNKETTDNGSDSNEAMGNRRSSFDEYERKQGLKSETASFVFVRLSKKEGPTDHSSEPRTGTTISLDAILTCMHQILEATGEPHGSSSANTGSSSSSLVANVSAKDLDSSTKALCYNALNELMLCGFSINLKIQEAVEEPDANLILNEARSRALASFACHIGCTVRSKQHNFVSSSIEAFSLELTKLYKAGSPPVTYSGCHGTLALLGSTIPTINEFHCYPSSPSSCRLIEVNEKKLWTHALCSDLIDTLHSLLNSETVTAPTDPKEDRTIPLLSTIYDIFTLSRSTDLCPPASVRLRAVLMCLHLCSSRNCSLISSQGKVLALQCAGSAIRVMKDNEAQTALNESMEDTHPSETSGVLEDAFESLINDLLVRRYLASKQDRSSDTDVTSKDRQFIAQLTSHEALAKESTDIENFPVEKDKRATAGWLCGDNLLMMRMGDSRSRHRGWIEVTVRSPTCRLRHLVRLPLCNSIPDPEFPSSLWTLTRSINKASEAANSDGTITIDQKDSADEKVGTPDVVREVSRYNKSNSVALTEAQKVLRRFDTVVVEPSFVLPPSDREGDEDISKKEQEHVRGDVVEEADIIKDEEDIKNEKSDLESSRDELKAVLFKMDSLIVTGGVRNDEKPPSHDRSLSADNLRPDHTRLPSVDEITPTPEAMTAHYWLRSILGRSTKNIERVEEELRMLGFRDSLIGSSPDQTSPRKTSGESFVIHRVFEHARLQSGPNLERAVGLLDRTACSLQTHKIALLFAGPCNRSITTAESKSQSPTEESILLRATQGSPEFIEFSRGLGDMVMTRHLKYFSGGLDTSNHQADGEVALAWVGDDDDCRGYDGSVTAKTMVLFHSVPLMPPGTNNRKRHVGNDLVCIIFADKDDEGVNGFGRMGSNYDYETDDEEENGVLSGEFGFIRIIVSPSADEGLFRVCVKARANLDIETSAAVSHLLGTSLFPKETAATCVRQLAIRADIACRSTASMQDRLGLVSNWEERLEQIRKLGRHVLQR